MAIAIEIVIASGEVLRVGLEESAELRLIHPVAIIVQFQVTQILPAGEEEPVPKG